MRGLIDTHFHLDHYQDYLEKSNQITQLEQYTMCVTNSPGIFRTCKNLNIESDYLKFALGFHPLDTTLAKKDLNDFLIQLPKSNYIGEIGLDYGKKSAMEKQLQLYAFETIIEAGAASNKLMTIHIRNAEKDAIEILKKYHPQKAIIHWYTGSLSNMQSLLDVGCYFSINNSMVYSNSHNYYRSIPQERLLIESDGPYSRINGRRYSPEMLLEIYQIIAKYFENPDLVRTVFSNFKTILTNT